MSARNTGTPAVESCSAIMCSVTVLPACCPGHEAMPVHHRERQPDGGVLVEFAVDDRRSELDRRTVQGYPFWMVATLSAVDLMAMRLA